jgi:uncharacterized protein
MDRAQVLSPPAAERLERALERFERSAGHQIVVHTTPSLEGLPIEDYSIRVAERWKAGHAGLDNGVILTVAPGERAVRIEVGYGLEGAIPDLVASRIIREGILPEFRRGDLEAGVLVGVDQIVAAARGEVVATPRAQRRKTPGGSGTGLGHLLWLLILVLFLGPRGLFLLPFLGGMGRHRGGFGGGFGGGGGGFGGGGASGSW